MWFWSVKVEMPVKHSHGDNEDTVGHESRV